MKLRGSVTVFAALIFAVVMSLFITIIESARIQGARVMVSMAGSLALDTLFSRYERELLDQYGVLLFDGANGGSAIDYGYLENRINEGLSFNLKGDEGLLLVNSTDFYDISIDDIEISNVITSDMACGLIWRTMINDYAKVDYSVSVLEEILQIETISKQNEQLSPVIDSVSECYDSVAEISSNYLRLIELIDGVKCGDSGINFNNLKVHSEFVKKLCPMELFDPTMEVISINDSRIYNAVRSDIFDVNFYFRELLSQYKVWNTGDETLLENLILKANVIRDFLWKESRLIKEAMDTIEVLKDSDSSLLAQINSARSALEGCADTIDIRFYESISADMEALDADARLWAQKGEQLNSIYDVLENNYQIVMETYNLCPDISGCVSWDKWDPTSRAVNYSLFENASQCIKKYQTGGMYLDYSGLEAAETKADGSILDIIYSYARDGILGLVMPAGSKVSTKSIGLKDMASDYAVYGNRNGIITSAANDVANEMLFNVYLYDMYSNFTKNNGSGVIDYELEYVIFGGAKDKDNLSSAVLAISGIRLGCNLLNIYTDAERKSEAGALAASLIGFVGIPLLVKGLEYTILTAWAIGETIVDIRCLLDGGKVPLIKSKGDWNLSLDKLARFDLSVQTDKSKEGLGYSEYLCGVLFLTDWQKKAYRSMDIVELNMLGAGIADFRIRNYIYGMEIKVTYHLGDSAKKYTEYLAYTY